MTNKKTIYYCSTVEPYCCTVEGKRERGKVVPRCQKCSKHGVKRYVAAKEKAVGRKCKALRQRADSHLLTRDKA